MLYSEFVDRVGRAYTEEEYHKEIEPEYYAFDGNKDEFCLKIIGRELVRANDKCMESCRYLKQAADEKDEAQAEVLRENADMWIAIWNDLRRHQIALIKRMYA